VGIGFSIFLFVIGAILTFAVEVGTGRWPEVRSWRNAVSSATSLDVMPR